MGEEVAAEYDGAYKVSQGMLKRFGPRVVDTPISEEGFAGIDHALYAGLRPIIEFMTFSFSLRRLTRSAGQRSRSMALYDGGQFAVLINRGSSARSAARRRLTRTVWRPGTQILTTAVLPGTPADAKGLLKAAIRSDDPVVPHRTRSAVPMKKGRRP